MDTPALFDRLWQDYVEITPQAPRIHALLQGRGETFRNDHIALRTFALPEVALERLAIPFLDRGYRVTGSYRFETKRLLARSYGHEDPRLPRVFISELLVDELDPEVGVLARSMVAGARGREGEDLLLGDRAWGLPRLEDYRRLQQHSEYAAWLSAFGIRVNHFTVHVNDLSGFDDLVALNAFLRASGFVLNGDDAGRSIQGSPAELLEQSSTLASTVDWSFADGERASIPGCYYEFALRHADPDTGDLFDGFVTRSADKIFESTDQGQPTGG